MNGFPARCDSLRPRLVFPALQLQVYSPSVQIPFVVYSQPFLQLSAVPKRQRHEDIEFHGASEVRMEIACYVLTSRRGALRSLPTHAIQNRRWLRHIL